MNKPPAKLKLPEIAARIHAHLKRFEADPTINKPRFYDKGANGKDYYTKTYYEAGACASGSRIFVTYVRYQGHASLTKAEALVYLKWLDSGNVGKHWSVLKEKT